MQWTLPLNPTTTDFGLVVNDEGRLAFYNATGTGCTALKPRQQPPPSAAGPGSARAIPSTRNRREEDSEGSQSEEEEEEEEAEAERAKDCLRVGDWTQLSLSLSYETNVLTLHCDGEVVATATANNLQVGRLGLLGIEGGKGGCRVFMLVCLATHSHAYAPNR